MGSPTNGLKKRAVQYCRFDSENSRPQSAHIRQRAEPLGKLGPKTGGSNILCVYITALR